MGVDKCDIAPLDEGDWCRTHKEFLDESEHHRSKRITDAILRFKRELKLDSWDIRYDPRPPQDAENSAEAVVRLNEQVATIRIAADVEGDNIDAHVAHELAHILMMDWRNIAFGAIAKAGPENTAVLDILGDMEERICDTIAFALTGVTYIPSGEQAREIHVPFLA